MAVSPIDTNVVVRYLIDTPRTIPTKFKCVFTFFGKLENESATGYLPDLVLFQSFFVLTSYYEVPPALAATKLAGIVSFRGIRMAEKHIALDCLRTIEQGESDLVDAWLIAWCREQKTIGVYSFDTRLKKHGLERLPVE